MKKQVLFALIVLVCSTMAMAQQTKPTRPTSLPTAGGGPKPVQATKQINWMSWEQAQAQYKKDMAAYAASTNKKTAVKPKKFFIDMYTSWCGWCKKMDASTFRDPNVVTYMNKYYYPVKFDAERSGDVIFNGHTFVNPNKGAKRSTHQFAMSILNSKLSYPAYVVLDENLNRLVIYYGYKQVEDMLGILLFYKGNYHLPYKEMVEAAIKAQKK